MSEGEKERALSRMVEQGASWPDALFHERLYAALIELDMEGALLSLAAHDVEPFLRRAGSYGAAPQGRPGPSAPVLLRQPVTTDQARYLEILSRYYAQRRQHALAAHVLLRLAERRQPPGGRGVPGGISLEQRYEYLSSAVLQAKSQRRGLAAVGAASAQEGGGATAPPAAGAGLLELLEDKLAVLRFQTRVRDELLAAASRRGSQAQDAESSGPDRAQAEEEDGAGGASPDADPAAMAEELAEELKSITQLYNDYALPAGLWELCLEMLYFSSYAADGDNSLERAMWRQLIDQAVADGGVAAACQKVRHVASWVVGPSGSGANLPIECLAQLLEQAAHERSKSGAEPCGEEDVARTLLDTAGGATEALQVAYERLLTRAGGGAFSSPALRLRLLRSALAVLREHWRQLWADEGGERQRFLGGGGVGSPALSALEHFGAGSPHRASPTTAASRGAKGRLVSACNRYLAEVHRLSLPRELAPRAAAVEAGFRELEDAVLRPSPAAYR